MSFLVNALHQYREEEKSNLKPSKNRLVLSKRTYNGSTNNCSRAVSACLSHAKLKQDSVRSNITYNNELLLHPSTFILNEKHPHIAMDI